MVALDETAHRPKLSITLRTFFDTDPPDWSEVLDRAEMFERVGLDRLVVSDHVVFGERLDEYARPELGGRIGGRQPTGPQGRWLEPLSVLAAVAARTSRIRLGTSILLAALRRPVVLAKTVSTIDVLSGGRVDLGVGVGWQRAEYEATGLSFSARGRLLDETLATCQDLWAEQALVTDHGSVHQWPKPVQRGGPIYGPAVPVWVSGRSSNARVVQRVVRFGAGWIPWGDDAEDPAPGIERIRSAMAMAGRGDDPLEVTAALPETGPEFERLLDAGVTDFRVRSSAASERELAEVVESFDGWVRRYSPR